MPIYDYVCSNCGHEMEVIHRVDGGGPSECPKCGGSMRRAFAPPTVHFKGSGWARKDRAVSSPGKTASKGSGSGSSGESGSSGGSGESGSSGGSGESGASSSTEAG